MGLLHHIDRPLSLVSLSGGKILTVNDQLDNLRVLSTILTLNDCQVRKALNKQMLEKAVDYWSKIKNKFLI